MGSHILRMYPDVPPVITIQSDHVGIEDLRHQMAEQIILYPGKILNLIQCHLESPNILELIGLKWSCVFGFDLIYFRPPSRHLSNVWQETNENEKGK